MKKPLVSKSEAARLFKKHGSPLYVYRRSIVQRRYQSLRRAITYPRTAIYYACKANANAELLALLKTLGASIECVSRGEVETALRAGFPAGRISYTCSNITRDELLWVMRKRVSVHLDSLTQLEWWGQANPNSRVSLRVNRGYGAGAHSHVITGGPESKFGIYYTALPKARVLAKRYGLSIVGLEQHIGSNIQESETFIRAMRLLLDSARLFPALEFIDFGGGLGIPYRPDDRPLDIGTLGKRMTRVFSDFCRRYGRELELRIEPGRYIVAEAGALLARVTDVKRTPGHLFVGIDSGMNHLIRPALYGSYHHIFNLSNPRGKKEKATIVGDICESGDTFAPARPLEKARIDDIILIADAGAYGYVMSSEYNARKRPKEVVLR